MGRETSISWTDMTFNPWWGCTKVSPGCDHCYAETFDHRVGGDHWGKGKARRTFGEKHWHEPLKWNRDAELAGVQKSVFCASMADVMDDEAPAGERERLWELIDATPWLLWLLLTKRPQRYLRYLPSTGFAHRNARLGATTENQAMFDVRAPEVIRAAETLDLTSFVSYEPAIGPITMRGLMPDWVIFGGETGNVRRPMEKVWAESIKAEVEAYGGAFFMKQMSARTPRRAAELIPAHLLVRQMPGERTHCSGCEGSTPDLFGTTHQVGTIEHPAASTFATSFDVSKTEVEVEPCLL